MLYILTKVKIHLLCGVACARAHTHTPTYEQKKRKPHTLSLSLFLSFSTRRRVIYFVIKKNTLRFVEATPSQKQKKRTTILTKLYHKTDSRSRYEDIPVSYYGPLHLYITIIVVIIIIIFNNNARVYIYMINIHKRPRSSEVRGGHRELLHITLSSLSASSASSSLWWWW